MDIYNHCGQYNPYAGKTEICGGNVHRVKILWKKADGYVVNPVNPEDGGLVCDKHMAQFIDLGQRDKFQYDIIRDEVVGSIGAGEIETGGAKKNE